MKKAFFRRLSVFLLAIVLSAGALPIQQASAITIEPLITITLKRVNTPSSLTAKPSPNMGITLNWTDNSSNEAGFVLQRQLLKPSTAGSGFVDIVQLSANTTTYKDTLTLAQYAEGFRIGEYRIKALSPGLILDSVYTDVSCIEFNAPEQPQVTVQFHYDSSIKVKWSGCTEAYVYQYIVIRRAPGESEAILATLPANTLQYYDASQKTGKLYEYYLVVKGYYDGRVSAPVSISLPAVAPAAPTNLAVIPTSVNTINITWKDNSDNETGFIIYCDFNGVAIAPMYSTGEQHYLDNGLAPGTYTFKMRAINAAGSSAATPQVMITIPFTAPAAPSNLAATPLSSSSVSLTWSDNSSNESAFRIERKPGSGSYSIITETAAGVTSYTDNGLTGNTVYTYRAVAVNAIGISDYSGAASVTTKESSGIDTSTASPWAVSEILAAAEYGLLTDKLRNNFNLNISREEFCEIAIRLYEKLSHGQAILDGNNPFTDTTNSEVIKAYKLGITSGTSPTQFSPNNPISRQEICVMIVNTLKAAFPTLNTAVSNPNIFADNSAIASWALDEVRYAYLKEIMTGIGGNMFDPLNTTKRDQGVAIIKRSYVSYTL